MPTEAQDTPVTIRVPKAAKLFGLSENYLYDAAGRGDIRSLKLGTGRNAPRLLFYESLLDYLERQAAGS